MRYFRSKRKKWNELTTEEKVNMTRANYECPSEPIISIFILFVYFIGMIMIILFASKIISNSQMINDLYNQTGIVISDEINQTITGDYELANLLTNYMLIICYVFLGILLVLYFYDSHKHDKKWKPFYDSLRKKEQVKY